MKENSFPQPHNSTLSVGNQANGRDSDCRNGNESDLQIATEIITILNDVVDKVCLSLGEECLAFPNSSEAITDLQESVSNVVESSNNNINGISIQISSHNQEILQGDKNTGESSHSKNNNSYNCGCKMQGSPGGKNKWRARRGWRAKCLVGGGLTNSIT